MFPAMSGTTFQTSCERLPYRAYRGAAGALRGQPDAAGLLLALAAWPPRHAWLLASKRLAQIMRLNAGDRRRIHPSHHAHQRTSGRGAAASDRGAEGARSTPMRRWSGAGDI